MMINVLEQNHFLHADAKRMPTVQTKDIVVHLAGQNHEIVDGKKMYYLNNP